MEGLAARRLTSREHAALLDFLEGAGVRFVCNCGPIGELTAGKPPRARGRKRNSAAPPPRPPERPSIDERRARSSSALGVDLPEDFCVLHSDRTEVSKVLQAALRLPTAEPGALAPGRLWIADHEGTVADAAQLDPVPLIQRALPEGAHPTRPRQRVGQPGLGTPPPLRAPHPQPSLSSVFAGLRRRLRRPSLATMVLVLATALVATIRFIVLAAGDAPATIDSGNWLSFAQSFFGDSPRDSSITYPPVVPALVEIATNWLGVINGVALVGALTAVAPALGLNMALRMAGVNGIRLLPVLLLLAAGSVGEAAAWGGFPQLLAMGLLPITMMAGLRYLDDPTRKTALQVGGLLLLMLATSHFVAVVALFGMIGIVEVDTIAQRRITLRKPHFVNAGWIALPSLFMTPIYIRLVDAVVLNPNEFAELDNLSWGNVLGRLDNLYGEFPALWQVIIPLAVATPFLLWSSRLTASWRLTSALLVALVNLLLLTQESRYLYFAPLLAVAALGVWVQNLTEDEPWKGQKQPTRIAYLAGAGGLAAVVVYQMAVGLGRFEEQRDFYAILSEDLVVAIEVADSVVDAEGGVIALPSLNDAPLGWWVEALTNNEVVYGSPLRWLNFGDEVERAGRANQIFHPTFPDRHTLGLLEASDIRVLIIPRRWAWFDTETVNSWIHDNGLEAVVSNREALTVVVPSADD